MAMAGFRSHTSMAFHWLFLALTMSTTWSSLRNLDELNGDIAISPTFISIRTSNDSRHLKDKVKIVLPKKLDLKYPDFFVIGAMKCGTTSLNKLIIEHPELCTTGKKEKHFFDKDEEFGTDKGLTDYLEEFAKCDGKYTIDSTPRYVQEDYVPGRIVSSYSKSNLAKKKFILVLREPIARQYSEYQMRVRVCLDHGHIDWIIPPPLGDDVVEEDVDHQEWRGQRDCGRVSLNYKPNISLEKLKFITFADWVHSENGAQEVTRGHYKEHIQRWLDTGIQRHQLFILSFQTLIKNTTDVSQRLSRFMNLDADWGVNVSLPEVKQTKPNTILDCKTFDELDRYYKKVNTKIYEFINHATDKPPDEPEFPWFVESRGTCT